MSQPLLSEPFVSTIPMPAAEPAVEEVGSVGLLLKHPQRFARLVAEEKVEWQASLTMLLSAAGFLSLYGLATGVFASGNSLWQATIKVPLIVLGSMALSAPSLYALLGINGTRVSKRQMLAMMAGMSCLASAIMAVLSPIVWLFGIATHHTQTMAAMHAVVWLAGLGGGLRLLGCVVPGGWRENWSLAAWVALLVLVCAQTVTYFRPVLGVSINGTFREHDKRFFYEHVLACWRGEKPGMIFQPTDSDTTAPPKAGATPSPSTSPAPSPAPSPTPGDAAPAPSPKVMSN